VTQEDSPQRTFSILYACLMIHDLIEHGKARGPMTVNAEMVYTEMQMLDATDDVEVPSRAEAVELAIGLMRVASTDREDAFESEAEENQARLMLQTAEVRWPP
jgi:hypothetical protein